ncbi:MAG TPA: hypothetical protein VK589_04710 [Chryseolinea sp.]|nr:hypothetical protein [Chryseolinea sp.]
MKAIIAVLTALLTPLTDFAQTQVNKSIAVSAGQSVFIHFDYPELIRVSTWDKNEVSIQGTVSINNGESDDAFELFTSSSGNTVSIRNEIKNLKNLPQRYTIVDGSQKITFKNRAELKKYQEQNGRQFDVMSCGVDMEIILEIKVPRNVKTKVESVYGMVEIKDFAGPLDVEATYGGVDAALTEKATGTITAETNFGEIYTNLDTKFGSDSKREEHFHINVSAKPGSGPEYSFESKYGNVYIRKAN